MMQRIGNPLPLLAENVYEKKTKSIADDSIVTDASEKINIEYTTSRTLNPSVEEKKHEDQRIHNF